MRWFLFFSYLILVVGISASARAEPKFFYWSWPIEHFQNLNYTERYLEGAKVPHNRQWDGQQWTPQIWIEQKKDAVRLIESFYQTEILLDQKIENKVPVLHIGHNFYQLSGYDQRRVVRSVDEVYEITAPESDRLFILHDPARNKDIGLYTRNGLQLQ